MLNVESNHAFGNIAFDDAMQAAEQPCVCSNADCRSRLRRSRCEYQTFIVVKTAGRQNPLT